MYLRCKLSCWGYDGCCHMMPLRRFLQAEELLDQGNEEGQSLAASGDCLTMISSAHKSLDTVRNITSTTTSLFPIKRGMVEACTGVGFFNPMANTASRIHSDNGGSSISHARSFDRVADPFAALSGAILAPCAVHFISLLAHPQHLHPSLQRNLRDVTYLISEASSTFTLSARDHLKSCLDPAVDRATSNFRRPSTARRPVRIQCS